MLDQSLFTETIREVAEIIRVSPEPLTKEEILGYFKDMELSDEQQELVLEFLLNPHPDEDEAEDEDEVQDNVTEPDVKESEADGVSTDAEDKADTSDEENESTVGVFQMYLDELKELPTYSVEKQKEMYAKLLDGDESVIADISNCWLPVVLENAKKLMESSDGECLEDVVQEGNMGLFLRLTQLCGTRELVDVESELAQAVENAMKSCILESEGEGESEDAMVGKIALVNEAIKYLTTENKAKPSIEELAEYTKVSPEELEEILLYIEKAQKKRK